MMRQMMVQMGAQSGLLGKIPGFKQIAQMKKMAGHRRVADHERRRHAGGSSASSRVPQVERCDKNKEKRKRKEARKQRKKNKKR